MIIIIIEIKNFLSLTSYIRKNFPPFFKYSKFFKDLSKTSTLTSLSLFLSLNLSLKKQKKISHFLQLIKALVAKK